VTFISSFLLQQSEHHAYSDNHTRHNNSKQYKYNVQKTKIIIVKSCITSDPRY